jgi:hypothetical protein
MAKKLALSAFLLMLLCVTIVGQASAQAQVQAGVSEGNTFKYSVKYFWSSTNQDATPPADWVEANTTEWYQATITTVTGTTVSINTVQHFLSGNETTKSELIDVGTGLGGSVLVYAANLNAGNYLYPSRTDLPWIINETVPRSYGAVARDTNHIQVRMTDVEDYVYRYTSLYFDKQTGVLVEALFEDVLSKTPDQTYSRTVKITESNVWAVSGGPTNGNGNGGGNGGDGATPTGLPLEWVVGIIVVVVVVAVAASVLLLRKRKKKQWKR